MKLKRWSQTFLAATASICAAAGLVSCGTSNTVDYLYSTSSKNDPGVIDVYKVDSQSGALTRIPESSYPAGRTPISLAADGVGKNLYVVNFDDNSVIQYAIGTDAKLYPQHTINPTGSEPVSVTVHSVTDTSGNLLYNLVYVVETLQPNFTALNPGPGALYVYKTDANGNLSNPSVTQTVNGAASDFVPLGNAPTAANVTVDGQQVFATDQLTSTQTSNPQCPTPGLGAVQSYNQAVDGSSNPTGVLTEAPGSPFCAGTTPSAIASHPFSTFLYITDSAQNQVITYGIGKTGTAGVLTNLPSGPAATGTNPDGIVVDPRGLYVYVANKTGGTLSGFAVNQATGGLSTLASGTQPTSAQPGCVIVEPALGRFVYTANFAGNSISGFVLNPNSGALSPTQNTFYDTSGLTQCVAAVSHGNHPVIHVQNTAG